MDEARRVLERLDRIEQLERAEAPPQELLAEVRALLVEAEVWVQSERCDTDDALDALERCRATLDAPTAVTT
jgi:hypothetical protein